MKANKTTIYELTFIEKIIYGILLSVTYLFSLLPLCVHYVISDCLFLLVYKVVGYRKKVVHKNLTESFPDKTAEEIKEIERKFYHFLCDYTVETIKLITISEKEIKRRIVFKNIESITDRQNEGKSVSVFLGHLGNWEWIPSVGLHLDHSAFIGQVYHIMENRVSDKFFLRIRERFGLKCVAMADILRRRVECKRDGKVMIMGYIADQAPFWNNIHYWTNFLNHPDTPVLTGAETITKRFNDSAVYLDISRPKRGYYQITVKPITTGDTSDIPDFEITERFTRALEENIYRQPELWLWTHKRWKRTKEEYDKMVDPSTGRLKM